MDTLLYNGDHFADSRGLPVAIMGSREILQRALIRLQVRRGNFSLDPSLGSDLHKLRRNADEHNTRIAMNYVREALSPIREISVEWVRLSLAGQEDLRIECGISINGSHYQLEVNQNP